ncbi:hypothetical protein AZE42_02920 [Rhizopogon vesiculosus]|uniref:Uncharacterized protein n=1 Tax=Rhizopogon vesiculosus TaxID=180088 RepID=A0A1J8QDS9_9AGAM|nr:hypothetical protein AZE42_02920 [Rhizopogon vesiculosus]
MMTMAFLSSPKFLTKQVRRVPENGQQLPPLTLALLSPLSVRLCSHVACLLSRMSASAPAKSSMALKKRHSMATRNSSLMT